MRCEVLGSPAPFHSEFTCPACSSSVSLKVSSEVLYRDGIVCLACEQELVVRSDDSLRLVVIKPVALSESTNVSPAWDERSYNSDDDFHPLFV